MEDNSIFYSYSLTDSLNSIRSSRSAYLTAVSASRGKESRQTFLLPSFGINEIEAFFRFAESAKIEKCHFHEAFRDFVYDRLVLRFREC